jgi:hypothetical protein
MLDAMLLLPFWVLLISLCSAVALLLLPAWLISHTRFKAKTLRLEQIASRAETLLQTVGSVQLRISERKRPHYYLDFLDTKISYFGKEKQWTFDAQKIQKWRVYDRNEFADSTLPDWNAEFVDSKQSYKLDKNFIENSESLLLIKAACVRTLGSNKDTLLEGLQQEVAKANSQIYKINQSIDR